MNYASPRKQSRPGGGAEKLRSSQFAKKRNRPIPAAFKEYTGKLKS
jgi:hypothetical protein